MTQPQAMLCALAAFFGWVLFDTGIKLAGLASMPSFMIVGIVGLVSVVGLLLIVAARRDFAVLRPCHWREQTLIAACSLTTNYANTIALRHLPLTIFYIVVFTAPLIVGLVVTFLKHEILTRTKVACLIAGFVGVVIAIAPRLSAAGEWIGYVAGLIGVVAFVGYTVTIQKIAQTDSSESIQFSGAAVLAIAGILGSWQAAMPDTKILTIITAAGFLNLAADFAYNKALQYTSSTNVSQIHYTQIIWGALIGYALWHEVPTFNLVAGAVLIAVSGMIVAMQAQKLASVRN